MEDKNIITRIEKLKNGLEDEIKSEIITNFEDFKDFKEQVELKFKRIDEEIEQKFHELYN